MKKQEFHCWYSKKMHSVLLRSPHLCGTLPHYYIKGVPTLVTHVTQTKKHKCLWDDMQYLGKGTYAYNK